MVKAIENFQEFKTLIDGEKPVVVDFWATWCGPCKMISPHFEKAAAEYPDVEFIKVDVDEADEIAKFATIKVMPTFIAYRKGQAIHTSTGAVLPKLKELLAIAGKASSA